MTDRVWCPLPAHHGGRFCASHILECRRPEEAPPEGYFWRPLTLWQDGEPFFWCLQAQSEAGRTPRHLSRHGGPLTPAQRAAVVTGWPWWWNERRPEPAERT